MEFLATARLLTYQRIAIWHQNLTHTSLMNQLCTVREEKVVDMMEYLLIWGDTVMTALHIINPGLQN